MVSDFASSRLRCSSSSSLVSITRTRRCQAVQARLKACWKNSGMSCLGALSVWRPHRGAYNSLNAVWITRGPWTRVQAVVFADSKVVDSVVKEVTFSW